MKVLVVDDSVFMRKIVSDMLESDPHIKVCGIAKNGIEAIEKIKELKPDVVTMDVEMPRMDGLTALGHIMKECPVPVVMLSTLTEKGADATLTALSRGAIDYVQKPSGAVSLDVRKVQGILLEKVKAAAQSNPRTLMPKKKSAPAKPLKYTPSSTTKIIAIGTSTGGPASLAEIIPHFPVDTPPMLIVQHMPAGFTARFAERLNEASAIRVKEASAGDKLDPGLALLAPGDYHMTVGRDGKVHMNKNPKIHGVRPAVDPMMTTASEVYKSKMIGVIMTGMGRDGAAGIEAIRKNNGVTIAQDEASSVVYGMPQEAYNTGCVDRVVPLSQIPAEVLRKC
ncbi:MAG: chemotaxis response regulator protein-glutamate methylesterase [Euryarchaeota archaeon]|nr:chemotaxis response regulator protein-glutamate methylesterase [Euryarchaeota archaeon]